MKPTSRALKMFPDGWPETIAFAEGAMTFHHPVDEAAIPPRADDGDDALAGHGLVAAADGRSRADLPEAAAQAK